MKIKAKNGYAIVEIDILVSSPGKMLTDVEVDSLQSVLGDAIIRLLGEIPSPAFSVADQEITVKR